MKEIFNRIVNFCSFITEMWKFEYQFTKGLVIEKYDVPKISLADICFLTLFVTIMLFLIPEMTIFFILGILASIISYFIILIFGGNIIVFITILGVLIAVGYIKLFVVSIFFYVAFFAVSIFMLSLTLTKKE